MRFGAERALAATLLVLAAGCTLRLAATSEAIFLLSSAITGMGMGASSALVPSLIGQHVPRIRGFTMGLYFDRARAGGRRRRVGRPPLRARGSSAGVRPWGCGAASPR